MSYLPEWPNKPSTWTPKQLELMDRDKIEEPSHVTVDELVTKSDQFPIKFPIETVRCKSLKNTVNPSILESHINSAYPLIHENALNLYAQFLLFKRDNGSTIEKQLYKDMTILDFIERLLTKRAAMFMGRFDSYLLINGTKGSGKWELIGKDTKGSKLSLNDCLSYDEIKLSVFLSVSSHSYFINNGTRKNMGKTEMNRDLIEEEGVVMGLIGARLKKANVMEYQEMVINPTQNTSENGYGSSQSLHGIFSQFYSEPCFTYEEMLQQKEEQPQRFHDLGNGAYFDNVVFSKRIALSIDTLLVESNHRASQKSKTAFIHVVGLGLGVWRCSPHQEDIFVETFAKRIRFLNQQLSNVSDVYFSYFNSKTCGGYKNGEMLKMDGHPKGGIKVHLGKRDPHVKLASDHAGKLLIVSYAWDGNSLPGNEFWGGKLGSSGDSAAAASTQIAEIHNSLINPKVSAKNLQILTFDGLLTYEEYCKKVMVQTKRKRDGHDEGSSE